MATIPGLLLVIAFLVVPGFFILWGVLRFRFASALLYSLPVGGGFLAVATVLFGVMGIPWTLLFLLVLLTGVASLGILVRILTGAAQRRQGQTRGRGGNSGDEDLAPGALMWAGIGTGVFAVAYGAVTLASMGAPDAVPTLGDAQFHMRGVQIILETGSASPIRPFPDLYPQLAVAPHYPTLWHALVVPLTGIYSIVEATNIAALAAGVVMWPWSLASLAIALAPRFSLAGLLAPVMAIPLVLMPAIQLFAFAIYPFSLSIILAASTWGLLARLINERSWSAGVAFALALGGTAAAQPTTGLLVCASLGIWALIALIHLTISLAHRGRILTGITVGAATVIGVTVIIFGLPFVPLVQALDSRPTESIPYSLAVINFVRGPVFVQTTSWIPLILMGLALIGAVATVRRPGNLTISLTVILLGGMYVAAAGPDSFWRIFTSPWWKDASRFATALATLLVGLAALTVAGLVHLLVTRLTAAPLVTGIIGGSVAAAALIAGTLSTPFSLTSIKAAFISSTYTRGEEYIGLNEDELALLEALDEVVEPGTVIVGDPDSGTAWVAALSDAHPFQALRYPQSDDEAYLGMHFAAIQTDPRVCEILEAHDITAFIQSDSPTTEFEGRNEGFNTVDTSEGFLLLHEVGGARIYEITACD